MVRDRNNKKLNVGDCVLWHDPDPETRDLTRLWGIDKINGDDEDSIILISDDFSEAEVFGHELELY
jgi:hypothetical protein